MRPYLTTAHTANAAEPSQPNVLRFELLGADEE
jgi:hypothetical protein